MAQAPSDLYEGAYPSEAMWGVRRRRSTPTLVLSALIVVLLAAGAAVTYDGETSSPVRAVDTALTSTLEESSVQVSFTLDVSSSAEKVQLSGAVRSNLAAKEMAVTLSATVGAQKVTVHVVAIGTQEYVSAPGELNLPTGKQWMSVTLAKVHADEPAGSSLGTLPALSSPAAALTLLEQAGATVTTLGASTVDGAAVQGYGITLTPADIANLLTKLGLPASDTQALSGSGLGDVDLVVDVSDTGLLRLLKATAAVSADGQSLSIAAEANFTGYGEPVTVSAPPATAVLPFTQALQALSASPASQLLAADR